MHFRQICCGVSGRLKMARQVSFWPLVLSTAISYGGGELRGPPTPGEEVIAHLSGLVGAKVTVSLEIDAFVPDGVPDNVVRIVTENGRTLKFSNQGFDRDVT
jgi:hypothetical protein